MSRSFGIVNLVAIIFLAALLVGYMHYVSKEKNEIEQLKLSYAIDYASDAAAMAMLESESLEMDYSMRKAFSVDPQLALDTFIDVFCFNYDLQPTAENRAMIKDYIPVATVATFDGYYMATHQLVRNSGGNYPETAADGVDWDLIFGMKNPYYYHHNGKSYAMNMGLDYTLVLDGNSLYRETGLPPTDTGTLMEIEAWNKINKLISGDIANTINDMNKENLNWKNSFYIPSQLSTISGVNSIEGPSFLVLLQGLTLTTAKPISGFSVSGAKIDETRMIAGYTRNGTKYYAYADRIPTSLTVDDMYSTAKEAALDEYYFDGEYME